MAGVVHTQANAHTHARTHAHTHGETVAGPRRVLLATAGHRAHDETLRATDTRQGYCSGLLSRGRPAHAHTHTLTHSHTHTHTHTHSP